MRSRQAPTLSFVFFEHNMPLDIALTLLHWGHFYLVTAILITAFPLGHVTGVAVGVSLRYITKLTYCILSQTLKTSLPFLA